VQVGVVRLTGKTNAHTDGADEMDDTEICVGRGNLALTVEEYLMVRSGANAPYATKNLLRPSAISSRSTQLRPWQGEVKSKHTDDADDTVFYLRTAGKTIQTFDHIATLLQ